jgi:hypothetical protein
MTNNLLLRINLNLILNLNLNPNLLAPVKEKEESERVLLKSLKEDGWFTEQTGLIE